MDVKSAFLYGTIKEDIYVCQPPGFEDPQFPDKVYKVEKALYGLHQAPRAWYESLSTYLIENEFRRGTIDKTLFIKKDKGDILLVQVYVDDIIFGSTKKSLCDEFEQMMHKKFQMSSIGELTFFLGDYAGASFDRKSTTGGCQFLGKRLISWQCKKQTIVANYTIEAEYNPVFHSKTKHIEIRHHFIRDCYEKKLIQLWNTAISKTVNSVKQIHAIVDGKVVVISESSVRSDLLFNDEDGIACLTNDEIFENLVLMGYEKLSTKLTFQKAHIEQILPSPSTYQRKQRKTQKHKRAKQITMLPQTSVPLDHEADEAVHKEGMTVTEPGAKIPHWEVQMLKQGLRQHLKCHELMETCTSLTKRLLTLEEAKTAQDRVITRLKLRVKRLKKKRKTRTPQPMKRRLFKGRVETSTDKSLGEDASKQGRNDDKIEELNLTDEADTEVIMEDMGSGEKGGSTADQVSTARPKVSAASVPVNISTATPSTPPTTTTIFGDVDLTIAQTLVKMRSENAKEKEKGVVLIDEEEPHRLNRSTITLQPLLTIDPKDKGKGVLVEEEPEKPVKVKRGDQGLAQIESDAELAQRLHEEELAELDKAQKERQKQEEVTSAALAEEFDKIQARIDVDHELVVRLTHEEQEKYTIEERARFQQQAKSTKKRPRADSEEESSKKQKLEEDNDAEKEELRDSIDVVPRDDVAIDV
ncbi:putative ribonuclease H-like domain-containing protein [Tanacetum coccineum]|uniref:Ribonuclease H-like domain-containing protein n=1 Tax=Tanacetum coccineum TaxID=301880 RepID=A0ABQ5B1Z7_9ASTR